MSIEDAQDALAGLLTTPSGKSAEVYTVDVLSREAGEGVEKRPGTERWWFRKGALHFQREERSPDNLAELLASGWTATVTHPVRDE